MIRIWSHIGRLGDDFLHPVEGDTFRAGDYVCSPRSFVGLICQNQRVHQVVDIHRVDRVLPVTVYGERTIVDTLESQNYLTEQRLKIVE